MKDAVKLAGALVAKRIGLWITGLLGLTGGIVIAVLLIIMMIIIAIIGGSQNNSFDDMEFGFGNLSPHVLQYKPLVEKYAEKEGVLEHTPIILAIMQQESGGNPSSTDPMQSSESLCGYIGCITNAEHSIQQGVKHFKNVLTRAGDDIKLAIHSYNFGGGFIDYVKSRNGKYTFNRDLGDKQTYDLAISFSQMQYQKQIQQGNGHLFTCLRAESKPLNACYGDILYVWSVMQYATPQGSGEWLHAVKDVRRITSPFRPPHRPNHNGVDYSCNQRHGAIIAVDDGIVVESLYGIRGQGFGGYGNIVLIKHSNNLYSLYAHLNERTVSKGAVVKRGQKIGTCGGSGDSGKNSYAIHLHLEARTTKMGGQFDPETLITNKK